MAMIGAAAAQGKAPPEAALTLLDHVARSSPLAPEPYLVRGATQQAAGNFAAAEDAFEAARLRDPRNGAARFFLAQRYLSSGRADQGIDELAAFSRVVPEAGEAVIGLLGDFARQPGAARPVARFLRMRPSYEAGVMDRLLPDLANTDAMLAIARAMPRSSPPPPWQGSLVTRLLAAGDYARARLAWRQFTGRDAGTFLFNPGFAPLDAPPPFNWTLASNEAGMVDARPEGGIDFIFYGRSENVFASQTLLLPPGRYRLTIPVTIEKQGGASRWDIFCNNVPTPILNLPLAVDTGSAASATFVVPRDCPVQALSLRGIPDETGAGFRGKLGPLKLEKVPS
ncbi:hypothetical protein H9L12_03875 [Sphingomonas rhizophila]|uniref:Uncharacterized protein n=1 Tax=Sphingomonas rhizophila TaxID=2071607 RepID=A0A7G9SCY2_9SPHN|nr:tetratricopeptide repeat protein [Sphingomonas rhizophila]QNN65707.1 hypothetical protein H9L12_03875 [Sphingomonas rhizophila]